MINRLYRRALVGLGRVACRSFGTGPRAIDPKTITLVVPYAAGGGTDTVARLIGERMSRTLGQTIIIENVVGGGSTLANDRVARSAPDGSTVLINHVGLLAAPSLFTNLRYDTQDGVRGGRPRQQRADGADRPQVDPRRGTEGLRRLDQGAARQGEFRAWRSSGPTAICAP